MIDENIKYWIALKSIDGVGNALFESLVNNFKTPDKVFCADQKTLEKVPGIKRQTAASICSFKNWDQINRQIEILYQKGAHIVTFKDEIYPSLLHGIYDRPVFFYVLGSLKKNDVALAVVGSRRATPYGKYTTDKISRRLAFLGITIVSGMARGIDSFAHRGALASHGRTIAVLGSGLDVVYPPENKKLMSEIMESGVVISEYPPGTPPLHHHFPSRNRIISGMSYGVLVVEAGEKSGSLITARLAMEQGRDVFAIPGAIDSPSSRGANSLIKQGAKLIDNIDDIMEDILPQIEIPSLKLPFCPNKANGQQTAFDPMADDRLSLDGIQREILNILIQGKKHADDIITALDTAPSGVLSALITLELKGIIEQHPGKYYTLKK